MLYLRAVHPIRRPDPPEGSDRTQPENWLTQSSHRLEVGHLFQKPTPAGQSRFSSPEPEKTRSDRCTKIFIKKFPESGGNFQNPAICSRFRLHFPDSGVKLPDSGNKLSYFGDLSSRSSDISSKSKEISPDLARSHQIRLDLCRIWRFSPEINYFGWFFHRGRFRPNRPCFRRKTDRVDPTPSPVGGGSGFLQPDSIGSVSGWAQTRPGPTRGHPYN